MVVASLARTSLVQPFANILSYVRAARPLHRRHRPRPFVPQITRIFCTSFSRGRNIVTPWGSKLIMKTQITRPIDADTTFPAKYTLHRLQRSIKHTHTYTNTLLFSLYLYLDYSFAVFPAKCTLQSLSLSLSHSLDSLELSFFSISTSVAIRNQYSAVNPERKALSIN